MKVTLISLKKIFSFSCLFIHSLSHAISYSIFFIYLFIKDKNLLKGRKSKYICVEQ